MESNDQQQAPSDTQAVYHRLTRQSGFQERSSQRTMAAAIADGIAQKTTPRLICAEGPPGTGKSMAYLIGAYAQARAADKKLVVATATFALQRQLLTHEIPTLEALLGESVKAAVAKGRGRFVCDHALYAAAGKDPAQVELALGIEPGGAAAVWDEPPSIEQRSAVEALVLARESGWDGDLDEYPVTVDQTVRGHITLGKQGCIGKLCPHLHRCPIRAARAEVSKAQLIITNHDLLLSDLAMGGGALLPSPEHCVVVIDEAHNFAVNAIERFTVELPVSATERVLQKLPGLLSAIVRDAGKEAVTDRVGEALRELRAQFKSVADGLVSALSLNAPGYRSGAAQGTEITQRWTADKYPQVVDEAAALAVSARTVGKFVRQVRDDLREKPPAGVPVAVVGRHVAQLTPIIDRVGKLCEWAGLVREAAAAEHPYSPPPALWVRQETRRGATSHTLVAAPTDVAGRLRGWLLDRAHAVIMTSATLQTMGTFRHFADRVGLGGEDATKYLALPSPFDLERQARLVVPLTACDPKDEERHTLAVARLVVQRHAPRAGTLVLFTSRRQMGAVFELLQPDVADLVLMSGKTSMGQILEQHRERVVRGDRSILFGLEMFSEGMDLPGSQCEVLVIARLPFLPPDGPVAETRESWLRERGRSYFSEEATPEAYRRLVQRLGRLIRTENDSGVIYVMDRRIVSTAYGRRMWEALPPYAKLIERVDGMGTLPSAHSRAPTVLAPTSDCVAV